MIEEYVRSFRRKRRQDMILAKMQQRESLGGQRNLVDHGQQQNMKYQAEKGGKIEIGMCKIGTAKTKIEGGV